MQNVGQAAEFSWRKRPGTLSHFALLTKSRRPFPGEALCVPAERCLPLAGMEWVDIEHRTFSGVLTSIFWSIGNMLLALTAYLVREWHWLLVAVTGPCLLSIIYLWWVLRPAACGLWFASPALWACQISQCWPWNSRPFITKLKWLGFHLPSPLPRSGAKGAPWLWEHLFFFFFLSRSKTDSNIQLIHWYCSVKYVRLVYSKTQNSSWHEQCHFLGGQMSLVEISRDIPTTA